MQRDALAAAEAVRDANEESLEALSTLPKRDEKRSLVPAGGKIAAERIIAAIRALPLPGEEGR